MKKIIQSLIENEDVLIDGLILAQRSQDEDDFFKNREEAIGKMAIEQIPVSELANMNKAQQTLYLQRLRREQTSLIKKLIRDAAITDKFIESEAYWRCEEDLAKIKEKNNADNKRNDRDGNREEDPGICEEADYGNAGELL